MPSLDFGELRRRITIREVLELLCFEPVKRRGPRLRGSCPIHESPRQRNRHFSVHLDKNCFRCFVCDECGNQLDLWAVTQRLPIHAAALDLCGRLGIDPPYRP
jgi:DNA primase